MKQYRVGVLGATGTVGQKFVSLLEKHPWFTITEIAASAASAGKTYAEAVEGRWMGESPVPETVKGLIIKDVEEGRRAITENVDFVFSAVSMRKDDIKRVEEDYARLECPVVSNNSAHRNTPDVPMIIPEVNPEHTQIIPSLQKRLGIRRGLIAVKSNCSLQSYVPALHPLMPLGLEKVLVCTYQAISGAGKNFDSWPEMVDNIIPYIGGEEDKSEKEPLKIWGKLSDGVIEPVQRPSITSQCIRVPVTDGHMAAVYMSFSGKPGISDILGLWDSFSGEPQKLNLPSAPRKFLHYFKQDDRPQAKLDRSLENGMAVSLGRLREDSQYDYKFVALSHNTLRGAAGGAVLLAELLCAQGYIT
ncbi:MAG: aspartate-semialdehyde dehydrogenase [Oscillospiraceae bacterium]|nr:aspartate-semialdehyde dehydrogenase [Oscillospiraceae bacterium]